MSVPSSVPFLDLVTPHVQLEQELADVFHKALRTASFIGGPMVEGFEREFARFCDTEHCIGVGSGTDALRFALIASGVTPGDIVITAPNTFIDHRGYLTGWGHARFRRYRFAYLQHGPCEAP